MKYTIIFRALLLLLGGVLLSACQDSSFTGNGKSNDVTPSTSTSSSGSNSIATANKTAGNGETTNVGNQTGSNGTTQPGTTGTPSTTTPSTGTTPTTQQLCSSKLAVVLVMDVSKSMADSPSGGGIISAIFGGGGGAGSKIALAIQSAETFLGKFTKAGDQVGLVEFSTTATILSGLSTSTASVVSMVSQMTPQATTGITDGLTKGAQVLAPLASDSSYAKFIVLMSDGINNGPGDPIQTAATIKSSNVTIFTVGFDNTQGASALAAIASGPAYFINAADATAFTNAFSTIAAQLCR